MIYREPLLRLGTSSWSCEDWVGLVYERGTAPRDYIAAYARKYDAVEVDSTFYAVPRRSTVEAWRDRTPETFLFALKAPSVITHEKFLQHCDREISAFLDTVAILGPRLGPVLFQFPYFAKKSGVTEGGFLGRLEPFLKSLPEGFAWVAEVRNKTWLRKPLLELLGEFKVPLALIDHPWMASPGELFAKEGILTGPFVYVRWLGDRYGIEKTTTTWNATIVDRRADLERWVSPMKKVLQRGYPAFGFANNHYSGYAPGTLELFSALMDAAEPTPVPAANDAGA